MQYVIVLKYSFFPHVLEVSLSVPRSQISKFTSLQLLSALGHSVES
jgi:hypothetical protein